MPKYPIVHPVVHLTHARICKYKDFQLSRIDYFIVSLTNCEILIYILFYSQFMLTTGICSDVSYNSEFSICEKKPLEEPKINKNHELTYRLIA